MTENTETPDRAQELEHKHHFQHFKRYPITLVEGRGCRVRDSQGREYIDLLAGIAVNSLGHCHPAVVDAIREQAGKLIHTSNLYYNEPQSRLAARLTQAAGLDRVFFTNSGAEANEGAFKLARRHAGKRGRRGPIFSMEDCFHGRTMGALSTHSAAQREAFEPLLPGFEMLPYGDADALAARLDDQTTAVILEPMQGEGGLRLASDAYLKEVRRLCDQTGTLLILDEIQCGMGRTGRFYAFQQSGITPDILTTAKALGGGIPIGAVLASEEVAKAFDPGDHGTTFGGNPLATAAADATVRTILEEKLPERAAKLGERAMQRLRDAASDHPSILDVRGRGLMIGVELDFEGADLVVDLMHRGVLANCTAKTVIRFVPPLNIPEEDLDRAIDIFLEALSDVEAKRHSGSGAAAPEGR